MPELDVVHLHKELVRIPSLSGEEKEAADFVERLAAAHGVPTGRHDDNVYFWIGEGDDVLLLNSHLDVVPASADHPFAPFDPVERDGRVYGRGSVDAKASVASMIHAALSLASVGWRPENGRIIVALTTCEETGGAYNGLESLRPHLPPATAALVGEPTNLKPCVAQKGLLILNVQARGRSAHAARAHLGDNAVIRAAQDVMRIAEMQFERDDPFLGRPSATVTTIEGGSARNVVPDLCSFTVDVRSTPAYSHEELIAVFRERLESDVFVHSQRIVPVSTPLEARIVRACRSVLPDDEPFGSPTTSDWIFLHDVPTVKIGPGASELSHTAEESVPVEELRRASSVYRDVIRTYFSEDPHEAENALA
jgi:acetylornithine deacetylase